MKNPSNQRVERLVGGVPSPPAPRGLAAGERAPPTRQYELVPASELPDSYPPIRQGAAQGGADGRLWILPAHFKLGG